MKKELSIALLFSRGSPFVHGCSANFRSFFAHFLWFLSKLPEIANFSFKIVIFVILNTSLETFQVQNSVQRATFNFRPILADFHEYTLNMTSYHVTEAINGYF